MSPLLRQHSSIPASPPTTGGSRSRPVVLATLAVPFDAESARVALQAAMEGQVCLIVVDAVEMPLWPQAMAVRRADLELDEDREQAHAAPARAAARPGGIARDAAEALVRAGNRPFAQTGQRGLHPGRRDGTSGWLPVRLSAHAEHFP